MEYPKPIMSISELSEMGYSKYYLKCAAHSKHSSKFVIRNKRSGKIFIKTEEFEKLQNRGCFH